jgi:hypothetical protein
VHPLHTHRERKYVEKSRVTVDRYTVRDFYAIEKE